MDELASILVNADVTHFNVETIHLLFRLFDVNRRGAINYFEFRALWKVLELRLA